MKQRLFLIIALIICGVAALGYFGYTYFFGAPAMRSYQEVNIPVPRMIIPPLHRNVKGIDPDDFKGKVTVVSYFASWCGPCNLNHGMLVQLVNDHKVHLAGVNLRDQSTNAQLWLMSHSNPYQAIGSDPHGQAANSWGVKGIPQLFIVDKKARIRFIYMGVLTPDRVDSIVLPMVRKLENEPE